MIMYAPHAFEWRHWLGAQTCYPVHSDWLCTGQCKTDRNQVYTYKEKTKIELWSHTNCHNVCWIKLCSVFIQRNKL